MTYKTHLKFLLQIVHRDSFLGLSRHMPPRRRVDAIAEDRWISLKRPGFGIMRYRITIVFNVMVDAVLVGLLVHASDSTGETCGVLICAILEEDKYGRDDDDGWRFIPKPRD
jgi:hypothetical protein